jgi:hypothetical protein
VTLSAPSLTALSSVPQCSAVTATQQNGTCQTTLTAAQVISGSAETTIGALGTGVVVIPVDIQLEYQQGSLPFVCTSSPSVQIFYGSNSGQSISSTVACAGFLDGVAGSPAFAEASGLSSNAAGSVLSTISNTAIVFQIAAGGSISAGTGSTVTVFIHYYLFTQN